MLKIQKPRRRRTALKFCFDEHPAHFGALFGYCDHQVHKLMGRMLKRYDVSPMQCRTLMFLHDAEDSVNQKTLERHLMIKPSTVNGIVDRLEEKGLVYRTVSATDGRCRILALTEEGQRFHDDFQTVLHQVNERLERGFTQEEKAQFTAFLLRAGRNLTDEEEEA